MRTTKKYYWVVASIDFCSIKKAFPFTEEGKKRAEEWKEQNDKFDEWEVKRDRI